MTITAVPFDPEIAPILDAMPRGDGPALTLDTIPAMQAGVSSMVSPPAQIIGDRAIDIEERTIPGPDGAPDLEITILRPRGMVGGAPGLFNIHGGGMISGHRYMDTPRLADLVEQLGAVAVNVEYRLAPAHPAPAAVEDCYAGLAWMAEHADELGVDPSRLIVMGGSAGGGLSAGVAILARDRGGPKLAGQLLLCPMIDDSNTTVSSRQYDGLGTWPRHMNLLAWSAILGDKAGDQSAKVPSHIAPIRETELAELPPAFIEAGSAEMFRDEDVEYASRIWAVGGQAELHVWSGAFHGFDVFAPDSAVTKAALDARLSWLRRVLDL